MVLTRRAWVRTILYAAVAVGGGAGYVSSRRLQMVQRDVPVAGLPKRMAGLNIRNPVINQAP